MIYCKSNIFKIYLKFIINFIQTKNIVLNFSSKQFIFINYLFERLNFDFKDRSFNNTFISQYLQLLSKTYISFKSIGNCDKIDIIHNDKKISIPKNGIVSLRYIDKGLIFEIENFSLINFLQLELNIKSKKLYTQKEQINFDYVSATDISNFTFCPVNYSISKTLKYETLEITKIGTKKHEESLINRIVSKKHSKTTYDFEETEIDYDYNFIELKEILSDFEVIYSGHSPDDKNKFFKSLRGKFIGQPDYILKNKKNDEIIVVEEKYQLIPKQFISYGNDYYYDNLQDEIEEKRNKIFFYKNHLNQISSYLFGISEYDIKYGILIYWKYEIEDDNQIVKKCAFTKVFKSEENKYNLNEVYKKILKLNNNKILPFNIKNRNPAKCASCVNNFLCGHKTGKFHTIEIPYNEEYLKLPNIAFPDDLKKDNTEIDKRTYIEKILDNISSDE